MTPLVFGSAGMFIDPPLADLTPRVRLGSSLCGNSDVELARRNVVSITLNRKRTALAVAVERGKGRKQFCAFSARARFQWMRSARAARCEGTEMGHPAGPLLAALKNLANSAS